MKNPIAFTSSPLALALACCLSQGAAQAQSSYTLTVLKGPALGGIETMSPRQWAIDQKDQVIGAAQYFSTFKFVPGRGLLFAPTYDSYVARWPATTAASVSPTKLSSSPAYIKQVSYTGGKILLHNDLGVFDTVTRTLTPLPVPLRAIDQLNDVYLLWNDAELQATGTWRADQGYQTLPYAPYTRASGSLINAVGSVVGGVADGSGTGRVALWANGQLQVLDTAPDTSAIMINSVNQVLLNRYLTLGQSSCAADGTCPVRYSLWSNGVSTPMVTTVDDGDMVPAVISKKGEVLGTIQRATGREHAFIWRNGVFSDLTAEVRAKGAKLPTGAVLKEVLAINDKGSILAVMRHGTPTTLSTVRLTAKP